MASDAWQFDFAWKSPPLTLNQRLHRMQAAKITADLRAMMHAKARHMPTLTRCEVELVWFVNTRTRRDDENPVPTLKALCDGLVDAEVVPDDTADYMLKRLPRIVYVPKQEALAHFRLIVTDISGSKNGDTCPACGSRQ